MKILQLPSFYLPVGGEFCRDQAVLLKNNGIDIEVLANVRLPWKESCSKPSLYLFSPFFSEEDGLTIFRNYFLGIPKASKLNIKRWINSTFRLFERYIKLKGTPNIIHVHTCMWAGYVAYLIKKKYNVPYVITEHYSIFSNKSEYSRNSFKNWHIPYLTKAYSNTNYILPVSQQIVKKIEEFSMGKIPIKVLSNIIDTSFFHLNDKKYLPSDKFIFFTANSYNPAKAYDILLKAFDLVVKQYPGIELRIAGDRFADSSFQKLLTQTVYKEKIYFCGLLSPEEVRTELWNADSFVLASRAESQSIATLEALSVGLPVVCTEVVPEEMITSETGYRVEVDNPDVLADAMCQMIRERKNFDSKKISQHAQSIVNPENFVEQTKMVYEYILNH